ncbi:hypothetical protein AB834_02995 [PVC group bacterium (ex Bugula neritina AB1)]|nr:hypothetical protein AB834_02995 [PVC group bacterium (ex Bugula neritina AB1)]
MNLIKKIFHLLLIQLFFVTSFQVDVRSLSPDSQIQQPSSVNMTPKIETALKIKQKFQAPIKRMGKFNSVLKIMQLLTFFSFFFALKSFPIISLLSIVFLLGTFGLSNFAFRNDSKKLNESFMRSIHVFFIILGITLIFLDIFSVLPSAFIGILLISSSILIYLERRIVKHYKHSAKVISDKNLHLEKVKKEAFWENLTISKDTLISIFCNFIKIILCSSILLSFESSYFLVYLLVFLSLIPFLFIKNDNFYQIYGFIITIAGTFLIIFLKEYPLIGISMTLMGLYFILRYFYKENYILDKKKTAQETFLDEVLDKEHLPSSKFRRAELFRLDILRTVSSAVTLATILWGTMFFNPIIMILAFISFLLFYYIATKTDVRICLLSGLIGVGLFVAAIILQMSVLAFVGAFIVAVSIYFYINNDRDSKLKTYSISTQSDSFIDTLRRTNYKPLIKSTNKASQTSNTIYSITNILSFFLLATLLVGLSSSTINLFYFIITIVSLISVHLISDYIIKNNNIFYILSVISVIVFITLGILYQSPMYYLLGIMTFSFGAILFLHQYEFGGQVSSANKNENIISNVLSFILNRDGRRSISSISGSSSGLLFSLGIILTVTMYFLMDTMPVFLYFILPTFALIIFAKMNLKKEYIFSIALSTIGFLLITSCIIVHLIFFPLGEFLFLIFLGVLLFAFGLFLTMNTAFSDAKKSPWKDSSQKNTLNLLEQKDTSDENFAVSKNSNNLEDPEETFPLYEPTIPEIKYLNPNTDLEQREIQKIIYSTNYPNWEDTKKTLSTQAYTVGALWSKKPPFTKYDIYKFMPTDNEGLFLKSLEENILSADDLLNFTEFKNALNKLNKLKASKEDVIFLMKRWLKQKARVDNKVIFFIGKITGDKGNIQIEDHIDKLLIESLLSERRNATTSKPEFKVGLFQMTPYVGEDAPTLNLEKITHFMRKAKDQNAALAIFPELILSGYNNSDLYENYDYVDREIVKNWDVIRKLAEELKIGVFFGLPIRNQHNTDEGGGKPLHNAYQCYIPKGVEVNGEQLEPVDIRQEKMTLPTYKEQEEGKWFEPGKLEDLKPINLVEGLKIGIDNCEEGFVNITNHPIEIFYNKKDSVAKSLTENAANVQLNISASPYHYKKHSSTMETFRKQPIFYEVPRLYLGNSGMQGSFQFAGGSFIFNSKGELVHLMRFFEEDEVFIDLNNIDNMKPVNPDYKTLDTSIKGLAEYIHHYLKNYAQKKGILGTLGPLSSEHRSSLDDELNLRAAHSQGGFLIEFTGDQNSILLAQILSKVSESLDNKLMIKAIIKTDSSVSIFQRKKYMKWLSKSGFEVYDNPYSNYDLSPAKLKKLGITLISNYNFTDYMTGRIAGSHHGFPLLASLTETQCYELLDHYGCSYPKKDEEYRAIASVRDTILQHFPPAVNRFYLNIIKNSYADAMKELEGFYIKNPHQELFSTKESREKIYLSLLKRLVREVESSESPNTNIPMFTKNSPVRFKVQADLQLKDSDSEVDKHWGYFLQKSA